MRIGKSDVAIFASLLGLMFVMIANDRGWLVAVKATVALSMFSLQLCTFVIGWRDFVGGKRAHGRAIVVSLILLGVYSAALWVTGQYYLLLLHWVLSTVVAAGLIMQSRPVK